ncbi:MAG: ADP-ribosylglycohydrolase family protein [Deltaproteobacteria bacterium]|jgi:ADP-ribosylglycohydrolase|nr:ADP-ribosylglycohydrolase family protein [Deltaproteobacteria bacterium]
MLGAMAGDIAGSIYERRNIKTKDFDFFSPGCRFTDDTVMTAAVGEALLFWDSLGENRPQIPDFGTFLKKWGRTFPRVGYGSKFKNWVLSEDTEPYESWGNGSAMRVSPCGWAVPLGSWFQDGLEDVLKLARQSAEVTHNHPEGIKGAQAAALAIFLARHGRDSGDIPGCKRKIKGLISELFDYNLDRTLAEIRPNYRFHVSCQKSVPEAIIAFLESTDFEDAVRNAISLGGDSDTIGAITGSIAEAAYGVPDWIRSRVLKFLEPSLENVLKRQEEHLAGRRKAEKSLPADRNQTLRI